MGERKGEMERGESVREQDVSVYTLYTNTSPSEITILEAQHNHNLVSYVVKLGFELRTPKSRVTQINVSIV